MCAFFLHSLSQTYLWSDRACASFKFHCVLAYYTTEEKIRIFFALFFEGKMINICEKDYIRIKMGLERWRYSPWAIFSSNKTFFILHDDVYPLTLQLLRKNSDVGDRNLMKLLSANHSFLKLMMFPGAPDRCCVSLSLI